MSFKDIFIWSSGGPFVQGSKTICVILVESIMRNNSVNIFRIWAMVQGEMLFKRFFIWRYGGLLYSGAEPFMQF